MVHRSLPIVHTLTASYRDWRRALSALRALAVITFFILAALSTFEEFIPQSLWDRSAIGQVLVLADDAIWVLLVTPVIMAVHRFVIQDVITPGYALALGDPVYQRFFVWLLALKVLSGLPFDLLGAMQALAWPL
ncbi:MAG: hypothetical protein WAM40_12320, partial [Xanthobacteraceae bacterium]